MFLSSRWTLSALILAGWLAFVPFAGAVTPHVQDGARIFQNPSVVQEANKALKEIHDHYGEDLVIETFQAPPRLWLLWSRITRLKAMGPADRDKYFTNLAQKRAYPNSIYVLVCLEPSLEVKVAVGREVEQRQAFNRADADRLRELLLGYCQRRQYDQGLRETVRFVDQTLNDRLGDSATPSGSFAWRGMFQVILWVLVAWLVVELVRTLHGRWVGREAGRPADDYSSGGSPLPGLFAVMGGFRRSPAVLPTLLPEEPVPPSQEEDSPSREVLPEGEEDPRLDHEMTEGVHGQP